VIGPDIEWDLIDNRSEMVEEVSITGFPIGSVVSYIDIDNTNVTEIVGVNNYTAVFTGGTGDQIRAVVNSLTLTAPPQSDKEFSLTVTVTDDSGNELNVGSYDHPVNVRAVADAPSVTANNLSLDEDASAPLEIFPGSSVDDDDSETLSITITVPSDEVGLVGTLTETVSVTNVTFTDEGGGIYSVTATGSDPGSREASLDTFLNGGIIFTPRSQLSIVLTGYSGIKVEAVSTEIADGNALAPNNSPEAGTPGDIFTKNETTVTYINVTVLPVIDLPLLLNTETLVQENNNVSNSDPDLVIDIGTNIGLSIEDLDGSQSLNVTLTGFPTNAQALGFNLGIPDGVTAMTDVDTGTVIISGSNTVDVLALLSSLKVTLADDDDQNFIVLIDGTVTDSNGITTVTDPFSLSHTVVVQAVADTPSVDVGAENKTTVEENSGFVAYEVVISLNDLDGSETYQSIVIDFSTPGSGALPDIAFGNITGFNRTDAPGQVTLTGTTSVLELALLAFEVKPGTRNGEDITVAVTVTAVESNPSESGVVGSEISVPTAVASDSFLIPVSPVSEAVPFIFAPDAIDGTEDELIPIPVNVTNIGIIDPDGSEEIYLEIKKSSYPVGTQFSSGGVPVGTEVTAGLLRISEGDLANLEILPPPNFSGLITLSIQGLIIDATTTDDDETTTASFQEIKVTVIPVADTILKPNNVVGVEDNGPIPFGAVLADEDTGIRLIDDSSGQGNNNDSETISQIVLEIPLDELDLTYDVTGTYVPVRKGKPLSGIGSAKVDFDATSRTYTITSTIITGAPGKDLAQLTQSEREEAEADIRATLASFSITIGPEHTDENGAIGVTATTLDVNTSVFSTLDSMFTLPVIIQAVADTPVVTVADPVGTFVEDDGNGIPLTITVGSSPDIDGSETLSVLISVPLEDSVPIGKVTATGVFPTGVNFQEVTSGSGVYRVTATGTTSLERETALNDFFTSNNVMLVPRENFAGSFTNTNGIRVDVVSTEAASGNVELAPASFGGDDGTSASETVFDYISINVLPVSDPVIVKAKANAIGIEDSIIPIPVSISLTDTDGSESFVLEVRSVPTGATIFGENLREIVPDASGTYILLPTDLKDFSIQPPLDYSSIFQGDIILNTTVVVSDNNGGPVTTGTTPLDITVEVRGVADTPRTRDIIVDIPEDQLYDIGSAIGDLTGILVDDDGSERLTLVLSNLPKGVIPTSNVTGSIFYLGNGKYQVLASGVPGLTLPPLPNFSGVDPYGKLEIRATSQELDGDQATSDLWTITFNIRPIIFDGTQEDGFAFWNLGVSVSENANEAVGSSGVSLSSVSNFGFADSDGSESVLNYTFDLSSLIVDAEIDLQLQALTDNPNATLDDLVAEGYITGIFDYNSAEGTISVQAANIDSLALSGDLFLDSNVGFSIPVTAALQDKATIDGSDIIVEYLEEGVFGVSLTGNADVPTVFAESIVGAADTLLPIELDGETTDTDEILGRNQSEEIYYIVEVIDLGGVLSFGFADVNGSPIGLDNGDGTWLLFPEDLTDLQIYTPPNSNGTISLELTTVAIDDDDLATNTTSFTVTVTPDGGGDGGLGGGSLPLEPTIEIGINNNLEDSKFALNYTATADPTDPTTPIVAVVFSDLPDGVVIEGAIFNPVTQKYVATAKDMEDGKVKFSSPLDFSGDIFIKVEAVTTNAFGLSIRSGPQNVTVNLDPVADGVGIKLTSGTGREDEMIDVNITLSELDTDLSEEIQNLVYIKIDEESGATLGGGYPVKDVVIGGVILTGYYEVPKAALTNLALQPAINWHGTIEVTVAASSIEPTDDFDGDNIKLSTASFGVEVEAVADPADITVLNPVVTGDEDTFIKLPGLAVSLVDDVETNGPEVLSVVISGMPLDTVFSEGNNNGDGSWTIPVDKLADLEVLFPLGFAGTVELTLTGITLELSNSDEAQSSKTFTVNVTPVADEFLILAKSVNLGAFGAAPLDLNIRMDDITGDGTFPGEISEEIITLTFNFVPAGVFLLAGQGGSLTDNGGGEFIFTGTEAQANALLAVSGPSTNSAIGDISISGVTRDGINVLDTPILDSFSLFVDDPIAPGVEPPANTAVNGGLGSDVLTGLPGSVSTLFGDGGIDRLRGGSGADILTGGSDTDLFIYEDGDLGSGTDTITDFADGVGGDQLVLNSLLTGYDPQSSSLSDFVQLLQVGSDTIVSVDVNGSVGGSSFIEVAKLQGKTGLDVNQLLADGNLIV
jgi:hypothetical protein